MCLTLYEPTDEELRELVRTIYPVSDVEWGPEGEIVGSPGDEIEDEAVHLPHYPDISPATTVCPHLPENPQTFSALCRLYVELSEKLQEDLCLPDLNSLLWYKPEEDFECIRRWLMGECVYVESRLWHFFTENLRLGIYVKYQIYLLIKTVFRAVLDRSRDSGMQPDDVYSLEREEWFDADFNDLVGDAHSLWALAENFVLTT